MKNKIKKISNNSLITTRYLVDTVISPVTKHINIQSVKAGNLWQLTNP